jgi:hypothetical protein
LYKPHHVVLVFSLAHPIYTLADSNNLYTISLSPVLCVPSVLQRFCKSSSVVYEVPTYDIHICSVKILERRFLTILDNLTNTKLHPRSTDSATPVILLCIPHLKSRDRVFQYKTTYVFSVLISFTNISRYPRVHLHDDALICFTYADHTETGRVDAFYLLGCCLAAC